jgi:ribosomal protein L11 methyltransferase
MDWTEIHITCDTNHASSIGDQLLLLGANAVTFQDAANQPIYEPLPGQTPNLWPETIAIGLFPGDQPLRSIILYFEEQQAKNEIKHFRLVVLPDQDWIRLGLENFKPMLFGKRLCICPSWITPPEPDRINIILDPGLAFGTGTHPTTALCLEWLDRHIDAQPVVIDYGCGSGILAIAALKLGAKKVIAVDHDEQALMATLANGEHNQIPPELLVKLLPNALKDIKADLIMANILAKPLMELAPLFHNLLKENGKIVLSGILDSQVKDLVEIYQTWFNIDDLRSNEEWVCLEGTQKSNFS